MRWSASGTDRSRTAACAGTGYGAGLTDADAARRLADEGPNVLPRPPRRTLGRRLLAQLVNAFALLLWLGAVLAWVAGMPQLAVAIAVVVVVNALFSFLQEARADRAASRLRELLPARVAVRRGGREVEVHGQDVVRGDVLVLRPGDRLPADAQVVAGTALHVDASTFTGESAPQEVAAGGEVLGGTFVTEGEGLAIVTATGGATQVAAVTRLTTGPRAGPTPLARAVTRFVRTVSLVAVGVGCATFVAALLLGTGGAASFVLGIGVVVALVPEGLLPTVTLALAWGAERMSHRQGAGAQPRGGGDAGVGHLHLHGQDGDPDAEPDDRGAGVDAGRLGGPGRPRLRPGRRGPGARVVRRHPFDPRRRRMSVVLPDEVVVKGAPDAVLPLCPGAGGAGPGGERARAVVGELTAAGLRVLAVAGRPLTGEGPATAAEAEQQLELYALLGLEDPPRTDVAESLAACRGAGVTVAMVTGDHPATATAIADQVGLRGPHDPVLLGSDLPQDDAALGALLDRPGVVVARVAPEQKLRIARSLRARGHVVAMTGDGVNDGPALHEAHVGVAMGASGTDVAREAADVVLLDDHFASIVAGIEQGRASYVNIRRFVTYHLTSNVAELTPFVVWALSGGDFPLALGVLQILAIDIGTDTITAVALGAEPPARHLLRDPPVSGALLNRTAAWRAFGVLGLTGAAMSMLAFVLSMAAAGWRPGEPYPQGQALAAASGGAFLVVIVSQVANAFACRSSTQLPWRMGWRSNRLLLAALPASVTLGLALLLLPAPAAVLGHAAPPPVAWVVALAGAGAMVAVDAVDKVARARLRARAGNRRE